jgi:hypothetical protein
MPTLNTFANVSSLANPMQELAYFAIRDSNVTYRLVRNFSDMEGGNPRKGYEYNKGTAASLLETDDLTSSAFAPALLATLTPAEIGLQFFVTDLRASSDLPENIISDGGRELGLAAADRIETDVLGDFASLTGGTIGAAGTAITWGYLAAAIAQARNANKSNSVPLVAVIHGFQWAVLAKSASIAGAAIGAVAPSYQDLITRTGFVAEFMGVPLYQVFATPDAGDDFRGAVFPRDALAIDWRRPVRIEPERDASRRGTEFNMSSVYAHGVWRANLGVQMIFDASAPTS